MRIFKIIKPRDEVQRPEDHTRPVTEINRKSAEYLIVFTKKTDIRTKEEVVDYGLGAWTTTCVASLPLRNESGGATTSPGGWPCRVVRRPRVAAAPYAPAARGGDSSRRPSHWFHFSLAIGETTFSSTLFYRILFYLQRSDVFSVHTYNSWDSGVTRHSPSRSADIAILLDMPSPRRPCHLARHAKSWWTLPPYLAIRFPIDLSILLARRVPSDLSIVIGTACWHRLQEQLWDFNGCCNLASETAIGNEVDPNTVNDLKL